MSDETNGSGVGERAGCMCAECRTGDDQWCCESYHSLAKQMRTPDADDASEDVETLAWMIHRACGCGPMDHGEGPICPPDREDYDGARDILASDWLAARESAAATRARAELRDALIDRLCDCGDFDGHPGDCAATPVINLAARIARGDA